MEERRIVPNSQEDARNIVKRAKFLDGWKDYLPDNVCVRLGLKPNWLNKLAHWKYYAEFLTLEAFEQFWLECQWILKPIQERVQRITRAALMKRASRIPELQVQVLHSEKNAHFDSAVEPIVASTVRPRWE